MQVDKITQSEIRCGSKKDAIYKEVRASKETNKYDKYEYLQKQDENPESVVREQWKIGIENAQILRSQKN